MKKHPTIPSVIASPICPFTIEVLMQPMQLSPYAFQRYLRKRVRCKLSPSLKVYGLPCGCFVWVHASGLRQLSAHPF